MLTISEYLRHSPHCYRKPDQVWSSTDHAQQWTISICRLWWGKILFHVRIVPFVVHNLLRSGIFTQMRNRDGSPPTDAAWVRCHMWVEFIVRSRLASGVCFRFSGFPSFLRTIISKFQFDQKKYLQVISTDGEKWKLITIDLFHPTLVVSLLD